MAVVREQQKFLLNSIGVARPSRAGEIASRAVVNAANQAAGAFFKEGARIAEKEGLEAAAERLPEEITTINPQTGEPEAYAAPASYGTIATDAYQRVITRRFQQGMQDEIKNRSAELAFQFEDDPDAYGEAFGNYIEEMTNAASGQFKGYIADVGTSYLASTRTNLYIRKVRRERAAARAAQERAQTDYLNTLEYQVSQTGAREYFNTQGDGVEGAVAITTDSVEAGLAPRTALADMSADARNRVIQGEMRYIASTIEDPTVLKKVQNAIEMNNPAMIPPQFEDLRALASTIGPDYQSWGKLSQFSGAVMTDAVQMAELNWQDKLDAAEAEQNRQNFMFGLETPLLGEQMFNKVLGFDSLQMGMDWASGMWQAATQRAIAVSGDNPDMAEDMIERRDSIMMSGAEAMFIRSTNGLSPEDVDQVELALAQGNPELAPSPSSQTMIAGILKMEGAGVTIDVRGEYEKHLSAYKSSPAKAQQRMDEARAEADLEAATMPHFNMLENQTPHMANAIFEDLAKTIGGSDAAQSVKDAMIRRGNELAAKSQLHGFFATDPSEGQMMQARAYLAGNPEANLLTPNQKTMLDGAIDYRLAHGSDTLLNSSFQASKDQRALEIKQETQAAEAAALRKEVTSGAGNPKSAPSRKAADEAFAAAHGVTAIEFLMSPESMQPNHPASLMLRDMSVLPETVRNLFENAANGGIDPMSPEMNAAMAHWAPLSRRNGLRANAVSPLSEAEIARLDMLSGVYRNFSGQDPELLRQALIRIKEKENDPDHVTNMEKVMEGPMASVLATEIPELQEAPAWLRNEMAGVGVVHFNRPDGANRRDVVRAVRDHLNGIYTEDDVVVEAFGATGKTFSPLDRMTNGRSDLFLDYVRDQVMAIPEFETGVVFGPEPSTLDKITSRFTFATQEELDAGRQRIVLQPSGRGYRVMTYDREWGTMRPVFRGNNPLIVDPTGSGFASYLREISPAPVSQVDLMRDEQANREANIKAVTEQAMP